MLWEHNSIFPIKHIAAYRISSNMRCLSFRSWLSERPNSLRVYAEVLRRFIHKAYSITFFKFKSFLKYPLHPQGVFYPRHKASHDACSSISEFARSAYRSSQLRTFLLSIFVLPSIPNHLFCQVSWLIIPDQPHSI
jgi:hypothetical protein